MNRSTRAFAGGVKAGRIDCGGRDDNVDIFVRERFERDGCELAVVLELGGERDEHERSLKFVEPNGRLGGRLPSTRADQPDRVWPV